MTLRKFGDFLAHVDHRAQDIFGIKAFEGVAGVTTALAIGARLVIVSLPTTDGTSATAQAGCLIVLNNQGHVGETFPGHLINGPWGMTALDEGDEAALFITNVLNDTVAGSPNEVDRGTVMIDDTGIGAGHSLV